jgi:hypothetical protein
MKQYQQVKIKKKGLLMDRHHHPTTEEQTGNT